MEFNIGDIVTLNSGGPEMTIHNIVGNTTTKQETIIYKTAGNREGDFICKWFNGNKLESGIFKPETILKKLKST